MFGGIDWADEEHEVCVLDDAGKKQSGFTIKHSKEGFEDLIEKLRKFGDPATLPVAIERPDGRLVDRLLEAGHPVVPAAQSNQALARGRGFLGGKVRPR